MSSPVISGTTAHGYESVVAAFARSQASDVGGAQLAVYHHGRKVVDVWTGTDTMKHQPYPGDGISVFLSVTKGLSSACAHLLVQRGLLDPDAPVAKYWPEFADNGKEHITVAFVLSHRAGLAALPVSDNFKAQDLLDFDSIVRKLAAMAPLWEPGTAYFYHSLTFGYLVGEIVRRITGKTIGQFFKDEIAAPLGLDLWIGLPADMEPRVVLQIMPSPAWPPSPSPEEAAAGVQQAAAMGIDVTSPLAQAMGITMNIMSDLATVFDSREGHEVEIPAANGIGDARSLAKLYATMIGPVDGKGPLFDFSTIERVTTSQTDGLSLPPAFLKMPDPFPVRFGLGYELSRSGNPMLGEGSFGHSGAGGRLGFAHPESGIAVGYTCNNSLWNLMTGPDARWMGWIEALRRIAREGTTDGGELLVAV